MTPRWYQQESVDAIWSYFVVNDGNPVVALPTGTGKSIVIGEFVRLALAHYPGTRIIKLTHVKELIEQNFKKLLQIWPLAPAGIYSAGLKRRDHLYPITYAGIGSVARKAELFGHVDLVLIDECHTVSPKDGTMYATFLRGLRNINPALKVVGFTATPYRLGQGHVTDDGIFTDVCYDLTAFEKFNRLVAEGWLAPLIPRRTSKELDVSGVRITQGDYNLHDLQAAVDHSAVTASAVSEMLTQGHDRGHWLVFTSGIEHAEHVAAQLNEAGVAAAAVHSKLPSEERDRIIAAFRSGELRAVTNNNVLTTGFDFPEIDLIAVLRPTTSPGLWVQMLGRGTRPCPEKENCLVLDFAGNTRRLGPINDPVLPKRRGRGQGGGEAPVKCCEHCGTWNHASVRVCVSCGQEFPRVVKIQSEASDLELIAGGEPRVETFVVDSVTYARHEPKDARPPSVRVSYHCGLRIFNEYLCFEHDGFARKKARDHWRECALSEPPEDVEEALLRIEELATPTHLRVWVNRKYPEIVDRDYTAAGFRSP